MNVSDLLRTGAAGLRARPNRAALSALGIAIGIATVIAVLGVSATSRADLLRRLDELGTNLLTVTPGQTVRGEDASLPASAAAMAGQIGTVQETGATARLTAEVYRNDLIPPERTGGITVQAATPGLLTALQGSGPWFTEATARYPTVVLGAVAARRIGARAGDQVWLGGRWFTVLGALDPLPLAPEVDRSALVGWAAAAELLAFDCKPTTLYVRADPQAVASVAGVLGRTVNPEHPEETVVARPSDALAARAAAAGSLTGLLLGLGAVALLVGDVGVANTMVISVLERRGEIGLRRSLGATRGDVRLQFLTESLLLSVLGGTAGAGLGVLVTTGYALAQGLRPSMEPWALPTALVATLLIGLIAGGYPATRAARLSPATALTTP
ncbi:ABC transporter permease [Nonomuraea endophytica]|uniref:ABC transporter permease n=1 Tax=Nonomuraea endophytica TaxID=714136 RepID=UPI0037CBF2C5